MYPLIFVWAGYVVVKDRMWRFQGHHFASAPSKSEG